MTTPTPDDDSYPEAWRPAHLRERDRQIAAQREEFEERVAALSDTDLERIRKGDR